MRAWIAIGFLAEPACSGDEQRGVCEVVAEDLVLDPCGFSESRAATIDVSERSDDLHADVYSRVSAFVRDAPDPDFYEIAAEEGSCRYLQSAPAFCDPACEKGDACTRDGECTSYPRLVSGGTLTVIGLGSPVEIEPVPYNAEGNYLGPGGLPLFGPEDVIGACFEGETFPALSMGARGVAVVDRDLTESGLEMRSGEDMEITWTPGPDPDACVQVVLNGFNRIHGAPLEDVIRCEVPDDGSLVVPRALVDEFPTGETPEVTEGYDWPRSELTRYTRSTEEVGQGPAALVVRSTTYFRLSHPK